MPLYELIAAVRQGRLNEVREIAKQAGTIVLNSGGVVRGFTNWGTFLLPSPIRRNNAKHDMAHYFIMRFDSSARTQHNVQRTLNLDPRMVRQNVIRIGESLKSIKDVKGVVEWETREDILRDR